MYAHKLDILFLGLAKNCARTAVNLTSFMTRLQRDGISCYAIIGENGSRDATRHLLESSSPFLLDVLDTGFMASESRRLVRMAIGREALLNAVRYRDIKSQFICVIDLDDVLISPPSTANIRLAMARLQTDDALFAVAATSRPVFYDLLALRAEGHDYSTLERDLTNARRSPIAYLRFRKTHIIANQRKMTQDLPIVCKSSFNGMCLYRAEDYLIGTYRAADESEVCEHVNFNLSVGRTTGKQMMIIPDLIIRAPIEHIATNPIQIVLRAARKRLCPRRS